MDLTPLAEAERRELADFLETLHPDQWQTLSLCTHWTVHQVAAHLISYEELTPVGLIARFAQGRLDVDRINAIGVSEYTRQTPSELVTLIRDHARPRGLTAWLGGAIALTDGLIHHQDIRRPLNAPRQIPTERLRAALSMVSKSPTLPGRRNSRGLRLVATDLEWTHGAGPEVLGTGEALLMALAGRSAALPELEGAGVGALAGRLSS
jgi:uncharacterized protein (TIGR03083 family)